jgi:hypothetical protein
MIQLKQKNHQIIGDSLFYFDEIQFNFSLLFVLFYRQLKA